MFKGAPGLQSPPQARSPVEGIGARLKELDASILPARGPRLTASKPDLLPRFVKDRTKHRGLTAAEGKTAASEITKFAVEIQDPQEQATQAPAGNPPSAAPKQPAASTQSAASTPAIPSDDDKKTEGGGHTPRH